MIACSNCGIACSESAGFCSSCGHTLSILDASKPDGDKTVAAPARAAATPPPLRNGGFAPGTVLAERYRIVALLGRGGMGDVYRAEDIKLGNVVALKFLPASVQNDAAALAAFHAEVRNARQVSHPNVCRVYDIGEVNGQHFLTMEYIDGEDLASLLRRIGHLPGDKALETANQICAGLAAAHDCGLLHRDLKPANIMLDGRGRARITDFGLALSLEDAIGRSEIAGTPAYMAPEQIENGEASVRTDIYSLGVVLYQLFTGRLPFPATNPIELRRSHLESSPRAPSSVVKDIDPAVESAILRCLQKDPKLRPSSARQVAAAFPGGDPLAAALAAGETPSPEMVAASGETGSLRPLIAWTMLAVVVAAVVASILMSAQTKLYRRVPLEEPPEALAERAREILGSAGYSVAPADTAIGFDEGKDFLRYIDKHDKSKTRWDHMETGAFEFWYRGSPQPLAARDSYLSTDAPMLGSVWTDDPPLNEPAMTLVRLNPLGRLTQFVAVTPQVDKPAGIAPSPDWAPLFAAAALDSSQWKATQPIWSPPVSSDSRAAWTGFLEDRPDIPMRIEAAAYRGKPVYFQLIGPWTRFKAPDEDQMSGGRRIDLAVFVVVFLSLLVSGAMLAHRNLRTGRSDRLGAFRLAAFVFSAWLVAWFFGAHHVPSVSEFPLFIEALVWGLAWSCFSWLLYNALEPYVRRRWPATLVSWSRLLAGDFRNPLVGRDVLLGCLTGASSTAVGRLVWFVTVWLGYPPPQPESGPTWQLLGIRPIISILSTALMVAPVVWLGGLFSLVLLRSLLRKDWAAAVAFVLIGFFFTATSGTSVSNLLVGGLLVGGLAAYLLTRFGLLPIVANFVAWRVLEVFPLTTQVSTWYWGMSLAGILLIASMALCAFYISLGGQPIFGGPLLED